MDIGEHDKQDDFPKLGPTLVIGGWPRSKSGYPSCRRTGGPYLASYKFGALASRGLIALVEVPGRVAHI